MDRPALDRFLADAERGVPSCFTRPAGGTPPWLDACWFAAMHGNSEERQRLYAAAKHADQVITAAHGPWIEPPSLLLSLALDYVARAARCADAGAPSASRRADPEVVAVRGAWLGQAAARLAQASAPDQWRFGPSVPKADTCRLLALLVGSDEAGGEQGVVATLNLWRLPLLGGRLRFVAAPCSAITPIDRDFQRALDDASKWLRTMVEPSSGFDPEGTALAWDLVPRTQGLGGLKGGSAGAAIGLGALWLLRENLGAAHGALRKDLAAIDRGTLMRIAITARLKPGGQLGDVVSVPAKASALRVFSHALGPEQPLKVRVARPQKIDPPAQPETAAGTSGQILQLPAIERHDSLAHLVADVARTCASMNGAQRALHEALLQADLDKDPAGPLVDTAIVDEVLDPQRTHTTSLAHYLLARWAHWAREQDGQLQLRYVSLSVEMQAGRSNDAGAEQTQRYSNLQQLLANPDIRRPDAFLIQGEPGGGKTTLLRHHEQALCIRALRDLADGRAPDELPLYVPLSAVPEPAQGEDTAESIRSWLRRFVRDEFPLVQGLQALLEGTEAGGRIRLRLLLDGLNELKTGSAGVRADRAREVFYALRTLPGDKPLPFLMVTRTHHPFDPLDQSIRLVRVQVLQWEPQQVHEYLALRFRNRPGEADKHWAALSAPENAATLALCRVPMHLDGQCELLEHPDGRLYADRASLYTAWLWQRLWRAIQRRDNRPVHAVFQNERLLSQRDRDAIEDRQTWMGDGLRNLPCEGLLLPTLFRQADEQWRQEARAGTEARARCAVEVPETGVAAWLGAQDRPAWLQAVRDLGLARRVQGRFVWSHPSWGEFLASRNLLANPDPASLASGKLDELLAAIAPPPLARRDADELAHLRQQVTQAWGAVPQAFWDRLLDEGLATEESRFRDELRGDGYLDQSIDDVFSTFESIAVFRFAGGHLQVDLRHWGDLLEKTGYFGTSDAPWHRRPEAWEALVVDRLYAWMRASVFERLAANGVSTLRASQGCLQLPGAGDLDEPLTLAVQGLEDPMAWLHTLALRGPLRAAAQATKAVMHRLEGASAEPALARRAVPLLRYLRRMLLLRSVDAGAQVKERVLAAGIDQSVALDTNLDTDRVLNTAWEAAWESAFQGDGVDVRERLEAGLLLGHLGDDLRYRWCERQVGSEPRPRRGLVLRHQHWIDVGRKGGPTAFELGDVQGLPDESPWVAQLDHFQIGACLVTNAEFKAFVDGAGYADADAPWWRQAGSAAQAWLRQAHSRNVTPAHWSLGAAGFDNPLQPALMSAHEARAYAHWAAPLYGPPDFDDGLALALPVEAQWEAGVRGEPPGCGRWPHMPPGAARGDEPDALCFNHVDTRWGRTSPVGVFSRGWTNAGVADAAGNLWEWTDSVYETGAGRDAPPAAGLERASADDGTSPRAARGGGFNYAAGAARAGYRGHIHPGYVSNSGVRLVRVRLPHFGH